MTKTFPISWLWSKTSWHAWRTPSANQNYERFACDNNVKRKLNVMQYPIMVLFSILYLLHVVSSSSPPRDSYFKFPPEVPATFGEQQAESTLQELRDAYRQQMSLSAEGNISEQSVDGDNILMPPPVVPKRARRPGLSALQSSSSVAQRMPSSEYYKSLTIVPSIQCPLCPQALTGAHINTRIDQLQTHLDVHRE